MAPSSATQWTIIGSMRLPAAVLGFARAPLVIQCGSAMYIVRALDRVPPDVDAPRGEPLDADEWHRLLEAEEAFALRQPRPAFAHAGLWILGSAFDFKTDAHQALDQRRAYRTHEAHGSAWAVLVDESRAAGLRDQWADHAFQTAWDLARDKAYAKALGSARVATELTGHIVARYMALIVALHQLDGDKALAEDHLALVQNSRGHERYREVLDTSTRFMTELERPQTPVSSMVDTQGQPRDHRRSMRREKQRAAIRNSFAPLDRTRQSAA